MSEKISEYQRIFFAEIESLLAPLEKFRVSELPPFDGASNFGWENWHIFGCYKDTPEVRKLVGQIVDKVRLEKGLVISEVPDAGGKGLFLAIKLNKGKG